LLAYATGVVNQKLPLQNGHLAAENRILNSHCEQVLRLNNRERATLAEIGKRLNRKALQQVACVARPDIAGSSRINSTARNSVGPLAGRASARR
jgi:hypothetical protein